MSKKLALVLAALALSTTLVGCGAANGVGANITTTSTSSTVQAKDYYTVTSAQRIATSTLSSYNRLRDRWMAAYSDAEKDRIEDQMLVVLSQGIGDVRDAVSAQAGATGYDSRQVFNIADRAISQYETLRVQWSYSHDINVQRQISNQMQTLLVNALQSVQRVRPY